MADEPLPTLNPYEPTRAPLAEPAGDLLPGLDRDELRAFVGEKADDFLDKWRASVGGAGLLWPAFVFNVSWLLYRKMYREALLAYLVFYGGREALSYLHVPKIRWVFSLGVLLAVGLLGSVLYLRHTRAAIAAAREEQPDLGLRLALLKKRGGVTIIWPLLAILARVALSEWFR